MNARFWSAACWAALMTACAPPPSGDAQAITVQMHTAWDRPGTVLDAGPVVVAGDYAVADWTQGDRGGRALMQRQGGTWTTLLCAGDGIRDADGLRAVGVPATQADTLAKALVRAEIGLAPDRLARMSRFAGTVRMTPEGAAHDDRH